jgi:hypothetical protein
LSFTGLQRQSDFFLRLICVGILVCLGTILSSAQNAVVKGVVIDKDKGTPIPYASIKVIGQSRGGISDGEGVFTVANIDTGTVTIQCVAINYDTARVVFTLGPNTVKKHSFYLTESGRGIKKIFISAEKQRRQKQVSISETRITRKELESIPTVGGEPDVIQYLQLLPGVVFSGDQGGQLYIRGGSPVMNKVLLDGMTIYNPFHSIGLFSVFDSDIIKTVDVYSAGFGVEYGGRISAIVDVRTRDGNLKEMAGKVNVSPFTAKVLVEAPLKKYEPGKSSSSIMVSYKNSYLNRTSPSLYGYVDQGELPYSFSDLYGKLSMNSPGGSSIDFFGFDYRDSVGFSQGTSYAWNSTGFGSKFLLVPGSSRTVIDGFFAYSDYGIEQREPDNRPRSSDINGFNVGLNFKYFRKNMEWQYGLELNGFRTNFQIYNSADRKIEQFENTTEIATYVRYIYRLEDKLIIEPGFRIQMYASLGNTSPEPRLRLKWNPTSKLSVKAATGLYSQNLLSAVSDRDVVNLFYGFLSAPDDLPEVLNGRPITHQLQKAWHAVGGVEYNITSEHWLNVETYIKNFTQITNINRNKIFDDNPSTQDRPEELRKDFIVETGKAFGYDITYKYTGESWNIYTVYAWNVVNRNDGVITYQPHFDRRHNVNVVISGKLGKDDQWELSTRWNYGSGFPFTLTQGFYEYQDFSSGIGHDYTTENGELGINYAQLNTGRLPQFHRLDFSAKRLIWFDSEDEDRKKLTLVFSVTNVYNRENIFYFNRVRYERINQLPLLPSVALSYVF